MASPRKAAVIHFSALDAVDRGGGVTTAPMVGATHEPERFLSGITTLPPGREVPIHKHNCDEQVTVLEGTAKVEVEGQTAEVARFDTTFVPAETWHQFRNIGEEPLLILWVYGALEVTRTFAHSGETVPHLSSRDVTT